MKWLEHRKRLSKLKMPKRNGRAKNQREIMQFIKSVIKQYGGKVLPSNSPRLKVLFSKKLPEDVIAEMHPYYDTMTQKPAGVEMWFNVPLIKKYVGEYFDSHERKAVAGTAVHELCHICHFLKDPNDYENRMHSGYHYHKCFHKAGKVFRKYAKPVNNDITVYVD